MDLGERISPSSVSNIRKALFNVEPLSDVRTKLADFFSILLDRQTYRVDCAITSCRTQLSTQFDPHCLA
jgi:hypothetical protein